jgi:dTDP-4-amino-4,6-dideoxygalactose transaminase
MASMWKIPLSDLTFGPEEEEAARSVIASGWLTMGERTAEFERRLGEALGTPRVLAVTNCTAALHLAYAALGVGPGDEVICPSLTFVATANAALLCGATVVLADVAGEDDLGIDPADVARKITPRTRAVAVVHYAGYPCDMDAIGALAAERGVAVVEDAAHAPLARFRGRALGTIGDAGCLSFFSNKNLAVGEGGAIIARDDALLARMRLLRSHGMTTLTLDRHKGHAFTYDVVEAGMNYRIDEIRSAIGVVQLGRLAAGNARRRELTARYHERLAEIPGVGIPYRGFYARGVGESAHHLLPVLLPEGAPREAVMAALKARGIQTSVHYPPIHRFSHHGASDRVRKEGLPRTDAIAARVLTLPLHPRMQDADVDAVCEALRGSLG